MEEDGQQECLLTDDEACEATGGVIRTFLLSLLQASRQDEGLSVLENEGPSQSMVPKTGKGCGPGQVVWG